MTSPFSPALLALLDTLPEPRILVDVNYRILAANRAYRTHFAPNAALEGQPCYAVSHHYSQPCDQCGESCPLQTALQTGKPSRVLHLHHTPRGEEFVDVELIPLPGPDGEIEAFVECMEFVGGKTETGATLDMVGRSPAFLRMLELINRAAPAQTPVLLLGESGTGKELAAQAVHRLSSRQSAPFVPVECSGLTESLFESELFGYEKGAFTGANQRKKGLVEHAAGGTLFLDEVGDIPLSMQVKLLRLLESGTFRRVGGVETLRADFRLVAATHRDLAAMLKAGTFRRDLYYRIAVFPIALPPLRARGSDIQLLAERLLQRIAGERVVTLSRTAVTALQNYSFPGNVRELRNSLERALLLTDGNEIGVEALALGDPLQTDPGAGLEKRRDAGDSIDCASLSGAQHAHVQAVLCAHGGNRVAAARALGISERTLYRKLKTP